MPQLLQEKSPIAPDNRVCDLLSLKSVKQEMKDEDRLTFPQIWVQSVCEGSSSSDDDEDDEDYGKKKARRPRDKVIRSLLTSSADVSFESPAGSLGSSGGGGGSSGCSCSSSPSSSRHNSLQLNSRENSVCCCSGDLLAYQVPAIDDEPESSDSCCAVWSEEHSSKSIGEESSSLTSPQELPVADFRTPVALVVEDWLRRVERHGFQPGNLQTFVEDEEEEEEDDTWFEDGLVRVFDPYYDVDPEDILEVDGGRVDPKTGNPVGSGCTVRLRNGDDLFGTFRQGSRQGRGSIEGENLLRHGLVCVQGSYRDGVLVGAGRAVLAEGVLWTTVGRVYLEGVFHDGYLDGPVRGLDDRGKLVFVGKYEKGIPVGNCWLSHAGHGWLYGQVNAKGRFSGDQIAFLYPDLSTCLVGVFKEEAMVKTDPGRVVAAEFDDSDILRLSVETFTAGGQSDDYSYSPSDNTHIACDWLLPDPYESCTVVCRASLVEGAGEGLFALRDLPKDRVIAYYNGIRVRPGEKYNTSHFNYQIYVDWGDTDHSAFVDVPLECTDVAVYRASLAHKANHGFMPNCQYVSVDHPRFGRIPGLKTITEVTKGDELFSHYKYDMAFAPNWYQEAWERFSQESPSSTPS